MKRRFFLAALFGAPALPAAAAVLTDFGHTEKVDVIAEGAPLLFDDGVLRLHSAEIGSVSAGVISSASGSMVIDMTRGVISLRG